MRLMAACAVGKSWFLHLSSTSSSATVLNLVCSEAEIYAQRIRVAAVDREVDVY